MNALASPSPIWFVLGMLTYIFLVAVAAHKSFRSRLWLRLLPYVLVLVAASLHYLRGRDVMESLIVALSAVALTWVIIFATGK